MMHNFDSIIQHFDMLPHPEGGYYKETYRSDGCIPAHALIDMFSGSRNYATAIYFLMPCGTFSAFHRIKSDEVWHFYQGCGLKIHVIYPNGEYELLLLGQNFE